MCSDRALFHSNLSIRSTPVCRIGCPSDQSSKSTPVDSPCSCEVSVASAGPSERDWPDEGRPSLARRLGAYHLQTLCTGIQVSDLSRTILPNVVVCVSSTVPSRVSLRSASANTMLLPRTRTKTIGPRGFFYSCPAAWNNLPSALRILDQSLSVFKKNLKTFPFQNWFSCDSFALSCLIRTLFRYEYFDSCCGRLRDERLGVAFFQMSVYNYN